MSSILIVSSLIVLIAILGFIVAPSLRLTRKRYLNARAQQMPDLREDDSSPHLTGNIV